jgi:hypothetical protein
MRSTFLKLFLVPAMAAAAALVTQPASAETISVPFSFSALGHNYPAGSYNIKRDVNANFVTLQLNKSDKTLTWVLGPGSAEPGETRIVLRFAQTGDQHVLDSIQFGPKITSSLTHLDRKNRESTAERTSLGR